MQTIPLKSWEDFPQAIANLRSQYGSRTVNPNGKNSIELENQILFRGQSDSNWPLSTTLERTTDSRYTVQRYMQRASSCVNEIESLTGKEWGIGTYPDILAELGKTQDFMRVPLSCYEFLVYLRHHGFPSPLLDWTTSPYIAAYFAMEQSHDAERCAVVAFIETPEGLKSNTGGNTLLQTRGPYVTTHLRHFTQKAWYSTATKWDREAKTHTFCSHHYKASPLETVKQDILVKFTIPREERVKVLKQLDDYNINHYTLFQSEDALVRTMGLRAFDLSDA